MASGSAGVHIHVSVVAGPTKTTLPYFPEDATRALFAPVAYRERTTPTTRRLLRRPGLLRGR
ncbi:MAG: hypothetical protein M3203_08310 [Actinomycetota bacterium]|nr:hypothetical protein [Actinomycetota bacterium]